MSKGLTWKYLSKIRHKLEELAVVPQLYQCSECGTKDFLLACDGHHSDETLCKCECSDCYTIWTKI